MCQPSRLWAQEKTSDTSSMSQREIRRKCEALQENVTGVWQMVVIGMDGNLKYYQVFKCYMGDGTYMLMINGVLRHYGEWSVAAPGFVRESPVYDKNRLWWRGVESDVAVELPRENIMQVGWKNASGEYQYEYYVRVERQDVAAKRDNRPQVGDNPMAQR